METLTIPYHRSSKDAKVVYAEDTVIELCEDWLHISVDATEEIPKDDDDLMLGTKERRRVGRTIIMRKHISAIETAYDEVCEAHDICIHTDRETWGYNVRTCSEGVALYLKLASWLTQ